MKTKKIGVSQVLGILIGLFLISLSLGVFILSVLFSIQDNNPIRVLLGLLFLTIVGLTGIGFLVASIVPESEDPNYIDSVMAGI